MWLAKNKLTVEGLNRCIESLLSQPHITQWTREDLWPVCVMWLSWKCTTQTMNVTGRGLLRSHFLQEVKVTVAKGCLMFEYHWSTVVFYYISSDNVRLFHMFQKQDCLTIDLYGCIDASRCVDALRTCFCAQNCTNKWPKLFLQPQKKIFLQQTTNSVIHSFLSHSG